MKQKLLCWLVIFGLAVLQSSAQSVFNDKAFYDSLSPGKVYGKIGAGLNINDEGVTKTFLAGDATLSHASKRHLFEFSNNIYYNSNGTDAESNRFFSLFRAALFRHHFKDAIRKEAKLFPELNASLQYDESRGLNYRLGLSGGLTYHSHDARWARIKLGTSLLGEQESWRIFEKSFLPSFDSLSQGLKDTLQSAFGINGRGNIVKANLRWNTYLQFVFLINKKLNVNALGSISYPLFPNFNSPLSLPVFPAKGQRFPRITLNLSLNFAVTGHISFSTAFFLQRDAGQISHFAKEKILNFSQGLIYRL
jgi:hypothetical protein